MSTLQSDLELLLLLLLYLLLQIPLINTHVRHSLGGSRFKKNRRLSRADALIWVITLESIMAEFHSKLIWRQLAQTGHTRPLRPNAKVEKRDKDGQETKVGQSYVTDFWNKRLSTGRPVHCSFSVISFSLMSQRLEVEGGWGGVGRQQAAANRTRQLTIQFPSVLQKFTFMCSGDRCEAELWSVW